jgi:hypothetical protein
METSEEGRLAGLDAHFNREDAKTRIALELQVNGYKSNDLPGI